MTETLKEKLLRYEKENLTLKEIGQHFRVSRQRADQMYRQQLGRKKKRRVLARFPVIYQCRKCGEVIDTGRQYCKDCRTEIMRKVMNRLIIYRRTPEGRKQNSEQKKLWWRADPERRKRLGKAMKKAWRKRK
jgi:hypothetical protein